MSASSSEETKASDPGDDLCKRIGGTGDNPFPLVPSGLNVPNPLLLFTDVVVGFPSPIGSSLRSGVFGFSAIVSREGLDFKLRCSIRVWRLCSMY